MLYYNSYPRNF